MDGPKISRLYYTTSDVCDLLKIAPYILRNWEKKFSFVRPTRRRSGRRLFKPQDLELVMMIKKLKDEGYTDEGISEILRPKEETAEAPEPQGIKENVHVNALMLTIQRELRSILRILEDA